MPNKIIPFNKIKKIDIINTKGGMTATQVMAKYKPDILINLALYDMSCGINITKLEDENIPSGYLFSDYGIGIEGDRKLCWTDYNAAIANDSIRDFVSGSPTLVCNGKQDYDWGNKYSEYINGAHKRTAIGFNDDNLILFVSDKSINLTELRNICINDLNAKYMINCDGGGSCHFQVGSKVYVKSTRKNASWLLVYLLNDNEMIIRVDNKEYIFASKIIDGRTYIKLRDFEQAGYTIGYENGIPTINKPNK